MSARKAIARQSYEAFAKSDRATHEKLLSEGFRFTSPLDNRIDRATFYRRCWPGSAGIREFRFIRVVESGDTVLVTYEGKGVSGNVFRNTEAVTIHDGWIVEVEVYFGWNVPHPAPIGGFLDRWVTPEPAPQDRSLDPTQPTSASNNPPRTKDSP